VERIFSLKETQKMFGVLVMSQSTQPSHNKKIASKGSV
jgi:hypothetical protein